MSLPNWIPDDVPLDRPNPARMYDYFLGDFHNLEVDRLAAEQVLKIYPDARPASQTNRAFLRRAVTFMAEEGVDQFLDIGSGVPTIGNVHEIAFRVNPDSRVVYVDKDPVAVAHSEAILKDILNAVVIHADARQPDVILEHPDLKETLDFNRPVAVLMLLLLPFLPEEEEANALVNTLYKSLSAGSYMALTHGTEENVPPDIIKQLEMLYAGTANPVKVRTRDQIASFFQDFELVEPGLVYPPLRRPEGPDDIFFETPERSSAFAGVGRKP